VNTTPLRAERARRTALHRLVLPLALAALLGVSGCVIGPSGPGVADLAPAYTPNGVSISFGQAHAAYSAELLVVHDDGLLVLLREVNAVPITPPRVTLVTWAGIDRAPVSGLGIRWRAGQEPRPDARLRLARLARYSRGLSDEQLRELLLFHGQTELPRIPEGEGRNEADAHAHHASDEEGDAREAFLREATEAARGLGTPAEALLAGYRPLGPDFPGMGVHWVNPAQLVRDGVDPARPPLLTFLDTPAGPVLTGVAFGAFLAPGEEPPHLPFPVSWHDHTGTVDDETLKLGPAAHDGHGMSSAGGAGENRLAMLHAWVALPNPAGVLAQDNWAVPFIRAGLPAPGAPTPEAGKALHLVAGGDAYYLGLFERAAELSPEEIARVELLLQRYRQQAERLTAHVRVFGGSSDRLVAPLAAIWASLEEEVLGAVEPRNRAALRALFGG